MEIEYLKRMDRIIKKAGTKDPDDVLAFMGYEYVDCGDSIPGFIAKCKTGVFYSVNKNLSKTKYELCCGRNNNRAKRTDRRS